MSDIEPHGGETELQRAFEEAYEWLSERGPTVLRTSTGKTFEADLSVARKGRHRGERVIRFKQQGTEYARAYECCWGHYYNCNRTRIGMYCVALDDAVQSVEAQEAETNRWAKEACEAVFPDLWRFAEGHCTFVLLAGKAPCICLPPGSKYFHIVLREKNEEWLFHELAHAYLGHYELEPSKGQRTAYEREAQALALKWKSIWDTRDYKPDLTNAHPMAPDGDESE